MDAKAARAAAVSHAADKLIDTGNPYLLGANVPASTRALVLVAKRVTHEGIPKSVVDHDTWGFNWARRFCDEHDVPIMRPRLGSEHIDPDAESELTAFMCFWIAPRMSPSPRKIKKGIGAAQPSSVLQAVYGYRRVQRDCGRYLADLHKAGTLLKGLNAAFLRTLAHLGSGEALAADHHIPFSLNVIDSLFDALRTAAITAWAIVLHEALLTIALFSLVRGPRLDEWCRMFSGDTYYRRSNFVWVSGRQIVGSTQQAVASGGPLDGWLVRVQNVPSKTARTGQKWVGKFMWYVLDRSSPRNFPAQ